MTALVVTTDELRVAAMLGGTTAPAILHEGWSIEDRPVADIVALRGLLARGLVTSRDGAVQLAGDLSAAVGPLLAGRILVEVRQDGRLGSKRRLIASGAGGPVCCAEREPDLWQVGPGGAELTGRLVAELVERPDVEPSDQAVALPTDLLVEAERRLATGAAEHLPGMLTRRGLPAVTAEIVTRLLSDLDQTVTVRSLARSRSITSCAAITWLVTGSLGRWLAVPRNDPADPATASSTELRPVRGEFLRGEVRNVLAVLETERVG